MAVVIDRSACIDCGSCIDACPSEALVQGDEGVQVVPDNCLDCGACKSECPQEAIRDAD